METDIHHETTRTQGDKRVHLQNTDNRHKLSIRAVPQYSSLCKGVLFVSNLPITTNLKVGKDFLIASTLQPS